MEGQAALRANLKAYKSAWQDESSDQHRDILSVWTRHADRRARRINCTWARQHASMYARRWFTLGSMAVFIASISPDSPWISVPLALIAAVAAVIGFGFAIIKYLGQAEPSSE